MSYRRDFTIGVRETQEFYLYLTLSSWWKGILGFGAVGALVGIMYTVQAAVPVPLMVLTAILTALTAAAVTVLILAVSTIYRVKKQVSHSGRASYVQETEINGFGVHVSVGKDKAKMGFSDLVRVLETRKAFYLFIAPQQAWILPKKQMEDPLADSARLRELFRTVIERKRLRLLG